MNVNTSETMHCKNMRYISFVETSKGIYIKFAMCPTKHVKVCTSFVAGTKGKLAVFGQGY